MTDAAQPTVGFWFGLLFGMILGTFVGGIALIGQGVWESGRIWGEQMCKLEFKQC